MRVRHKIESWIPETPREIVKGFLRRAFYPDFRSDFDNRKLAVYHVKNAEPALWSADNRQPYGTLMDGFRFPHFLLARAMIHLCGIRSWCDLGTGSATLPFEVARLGVDEVFAIDGSEGALRAGKVRLPLSNYRVADISVPLEITSGNGEAARFEVVSALELVEHLPDLKLTGLLDNIIRLEPKYVIFAVGLQPEPPYHVNLKSMSEWLGIFSTVLSAWRYDDRLSTRIFQATRCHARFINEYPSNHLPLR